MKTFVRLIRRYVLAAVGIVLLLLFSGVAVLGWLGWQESCRLPQREYSSSEIADSMVETAGRACLWGRTYPAGVDERLRVGDGTGRCGKHPLELRPAAGAGPTPTLPRYRQIFPLVSGGLPGVLLDRTYGLFVIGLPKGSLWKYSIYSSPDFALSMVRCSRRQRWDCCCWVWCSASG